VYTVCVSVGADRLHGRNKTTLKAAESTARDWFNTLSEGVNLPGRERSQWAVLVLDGFAREVMRFEPKRPTKTRRSQ
jgi:hypothetical protein